MSKTMNALLLSAGLGAASLCQADVLSVYAGAESWSAEASGQVGEGSNVASFDFDDETVTNFYIGLEHPVPVLPNIKLRQGSLDINGTTTGSFELDGITFTTGGTASVDLEQTDVVLYWEIVDLDLLSIDLGINAKYVDISASASDGVSSASDEFDGWIPMAYGAVEIGFPVVPLSFWTEGSYIGYDGDTFFEARAALKYALIDSLAMELDLIGGYQRIDLEVDDDIFADLEYDGYYAGIEVRF